MGVMTAPDDLLLELLTESRELGFLGPGGIEPQIEHARSFLTALTNAPGAVLDLGSGGGLPGLVLLTSLPSARLVLLDGNQRRCQFLQRAVELLGAAERATVELGRAEELARRPDLDGSFDVVVARSFGAPAVTAECAVRFLRDPGSRLIVSEPPTGSEDRWPAEGLSEFGLGRGPRHDTTHGTLQELVVLERCSDRFPRRVGIPSKRPMFATPAA